MVRDRWFRIGLVGAIVAALCCFTPLAVTAMGALGLAAYVGWLDAVFMPLLIVSLGILATAVIRILQARE